MRACAHLSVVLCPSASAEPPATATGASAAIFRRRQQQLRRQGGRDGGMESEREGDTDGSRCQADTDGPTDGPCLSTTPGERSNLPMSRASASRLLQLLLLILLLRRLHLLIPRWDYESCVTFPGLSICLCPFSSLHLRPHIFLSAFLYLPLCQSTFLSASLPSSLPLTFYSAALPSSPLCLRILSLLPIGVPLCLPTFILASLP